MPRFERRRANPKDVAAVILGGGEGVKLFPLTSRTATPAVPIGGCYKLIDIPMSNCINSAINKIFVLTQYNSAPLKRHIARTYFGNGVSFGDGFVEILAATQTPGEAGKRWFKELQMLLDNLYGFLRLMKGKIRSDGRKLIIESVVRDCQIHQSCFTDNTRENRICLCSFSGASTACIRGERTVGKTTI